MTCVTRDMQPKLPAIKKGKTPAKYSVELGAEICRLIVEDMKLEEIQERPGMPTRMTIFEWRRTYPEFERDYIRARQVQAEAWSDDILTIADGCVGQDKEAIMAARVRIDTRKWLMGKHLPRIYGERQQVEVSGEISGPVAPILNITVSRGTDEPYFLHGENGRPYCEGQQNGLPRLEAPIDVTPKNGNGHTNGTNGGHHTKPAPKAD